MLSIDVASGNPVCGLLLGYITHFMVYYKTTKYHNDILRQMLVYFLSHQVFGKDQLLLQFITTFIFTHYARSSSNQLHIFESNLSSFPEWTQSEQLLFVHRTKNIYIYRQWKCVNERKLKINWHAFLSHFVNEII